MEDVTLEDYRALAAFRYELRKFLGFSEKAARAAGIEPQQHQLLLAVKGYPSETRPTIGRIAERLAVEPHTAVGLVDKLEARGLVRRERSHTDRRAVLLSLTPDGTRLLAELSVLHRGELARVGPGMVAALAGILSTHREHAGAARPTAEESEGSGLRFEGLDQGASGR
jgi:DNA-binding MarR family transcriptional regulator